MKLSEVIKKAMEQVDRNGALIKLRKAPYEHHVYEIIPSDNVALNEHHLYKPIPGTKQSYRKDTGNTNTLTQTHYHIYAKQNGNGKELYSVNVDGSGHDGSSGKPISTVHADFFRGLGCSINPNNILEQIEPWNIDKDKFEIIYIPKKQSLLLG